ncbi:prolyl oligopeptidase family serine peptidase [Nocardia tengchongensis]|uniref:Prolyl oligopeptidase family serine peptidase n=1 Tax=Nocardia tengchongensis TaxID=2055889 RepID=A0ABX8CFH4_9NOCA|nr:lipase family protein [Nocardia tengchongensis]QVI18723.1 prolyl oligopeptidase family serine peptidase [Nocardia tengchongensis]
MTRRTVITLVSVAVLAAGPLAATAVADPPARAEAAGAVVADAALPLDLWLDGTGSARKLTYWTRDSADQPALSTGVVFTPAGAPPPGGWPVLSWEHGTVGIGDDCAPSVTGRSDRDNGFLATWLKQGYAIVATDYIGLGTPGVHAYLDGRAEAHAAIDMVRAARAVDDSLASKWVAIGQSQGGGAAVFTASLATRYAPELDYRGAVATGPASNIVDAATLVGPGTTFGSSHITAYSAYVLNGVKAARPDFDLDSYLTPQGKQLVEDAKTLCFGPLADRAEGLSLGQLLSRPLSDGDFVPVARSVMDVPLTGYDRPLFIGQGTNDTDVPAPLTAKLVADMTLAGTHPEVHVYPGKDHSGAMLASLADSVPFVARLFV